ncbi:uncharacterized protein EI90DRAFT_3032825 [Cantharellus anzutake]|uniref:uncharacterized protein n=1 Tax=Cantharellus anzutake TaxID=1750568 RepID=UPI0019047808|nr:uncharacterized protein EI90DRAFT_3032825 [Cantharellus anzutake]KAF8342301.1 hypothetical protein EI90DRAFT_3032825 [Cantharellus anzutake]
MKCSQYLKSLYRSISYEETDISMLHARAGTFKSLDHAISDNLQASLVDNILSALRDERIMPFLKAIFGDRVNELPIDLEPVRAIIQAAYNWNGAAKTFVPPADLRPFVIPNTGPFDEETMDYYERPVKSSGTKAIIGAGSIGLKLHNSKYPGGRVLCKITVLTPQNYGDI